MNIDNQIYGAFTDNRDASMKNMAGGPLVLSWMSLQQGYEQRIITKCLTEKAKSAQGPSNMLISRMVKHGE